MPISLNNFGIQGFVFPVPSGGSTDYPAVGDVELGVSYDFGSMVGTFVVPSTGDVRNGIGYGAEGTEFTGTLSAPSPPVVGTGFSPADIVRWIMIQLGLGVAPSTRTVGNPWPVSVGLEPAQPDDCITVKNTVGMNDGRAMINGVPYAHFGIQIRVRSTDEITGWQKINSIRTTLATQVRMYSITIGTETYNVAAITHIGQVIPIGKETPSSKRNVFTLNCTVAITPQPLT